MTEEPGLDSTDSNSSLGERLREANEEELTGLIAELGDRLADPRLARHALRNPYLASAHVEALAALPALAASYEFRRDAVCHPRTPRLIALRFAGGLYWADLVRVGTDTRLHPIVRRSADLRLIERLPGLSIGERIAIARSAGPAVVAALRLDPTPRVIGALLENPRLTEGVLIPLVANDRANPQVLALVARTGRWSARGPIRYALCRNPATPVAASLGLLPGLAKRELEAVANEARAPLPVRRRAQLLCGASGRRGSG